MITSLHRRAISLRISSQSNWVRNIHVKNVITSLERRAVSQPSLKLRFYFNQVHIVHAVLNLTHGPQQSDLAAARGLNLKLYKQYILVYDVIMVDFQVSFINLRIMNDLLQFFKIFKK